jgi:hypothetical protein
MALDPSTEPCSLLNAAAYPTLFIRPTATEADAYPKIVSGGNLLAYDATMNAAGIDATVAVLSSTANRSTSSLRLIQFLSGGGVTGGGSTNYTQLQNVALYYLDGTTRKYESIISGYVTGNTPASIRILNYDPKNLVSPATSLIQPSQFWNSSDADADGSIISSPTSLLGKLIKKQYLLSQAQIYNPGQLAVSPNISVGQESLIYLYKLQQGTTPLTPSQTTLKNTLEATNLRFFGAFMVEYCFYRTRYEWLLKQYFTIYTQKTAANGGSGTTLYTSPAPGSPPMQLFGGSVPNPSGAGVTQADYLNALAYHMAALNMRMADMRQLLTAVNTYYNGVFTLVQNNVNSASVSGGNAALTQTITALQASSDTANKYLTEQDFAHQVMEYNSEKNRYSNILLGLYAFLNIAALASVFHLARS